jgi:hypothetical protein
MPHSSVPSSGTSRGRIRRRQVLETDSDTSSISNIDDPLDSSDPETSSLSSSDSETGSNDEHNDSSTSSGCLICLMEPNLSTINTCPTHLTFLTLTHLSRRHVYRSRAKRCYQSSHSSSSSSISPPRRKRRSMTVHSSVRIPCLFIDTDKRLFRALRVTVVMMMMISSSPRLRSLQGKCDDEA